MSRDIVTLIGDAESGLVRVMLGQEEVGALDEDADIQRDSRFWQACNDESELWDLAQKFREKYSDRFEFSEMSL